MITKCWNPLGYWKYSCGCIQYQDGSERCSEHTVALPEATEVEDVYAIRATERLKTPRESGPIAHVYLMHTRATMPKYKTFGSVGMDVAICEEVTIRPDEWKRVHTGLIVSPPDGYFAAMYGRSSLPARGLMLANNVGIVDPDFCGPEDEILISLWNFGAQPVRLESGERLAQIVFTPYVRCERELFQPKGPSRGGYGSTGVK